MTPAVPKAGRLAVGQPLAIAALVGTLALGTGTASADEALVAVAANFSEVAESLSQEFERSSGHALVLSTGSTGKLYAQITRSAPYHLLLAADAATPARLEAEDRAVAGTRFTYALGRLALWSADPDRIGPDGRDALLDPAVRHVAIANPSLAPYGVAARETLESLGLWDAIQPRIVMGENIGQTHSFVATGAAEVGFVAFSAVMSPKLHGRGSYWEVPPALYRPIRQDAVLLLPGAANPAATDFMSYLRSEPARRTIAAFGYGVQ